MMLNRGQQLWVGVGWGGRHSVGGQGPGMSRGRLQPRELAEMQGLWACPMATGQVDLETCISNFVFHNS